MPHSYNHMYVPQLRRDPPSFCRRYFSAYTIRASWPNLNEMAMEGENNRSVKSFEERKYKERKVERKWAFAYDGGKRKHILLE